MPNHEDARKLQALEEKRKERSQHTLQAGTSRIRNWFVLGFGMPVFPLVCIALFQMVMGLLAGDGFQAMFWDALFLILIGLFWGLLLGCVLALLAGLSLGAGMGLDTYQNMQAARERREILDRSEVVGAVHIAGPEQGGGSLEMVSEQGALDLVPSEVELDFGDPRSEQDETSVHEVKAYPSEW